MNGANGSFKAQEFAALAGVTVRALHHYDRLGLLRPSRTDAGYRLYRARDVERLEQIVALKFIGLPLKQIKHLLDQNAPELAAALRSQRLALEEKRRLLDLAIQAIQQAEMAVGSGRNSDAAILKNIIEVIEMQNDSQWATKYYSPEAQAKIEERKHLWSPELQERVSQQWSDLFRDVEASLSEDPAGEKAQGLAARWKVLVEGFTGGDPEIRQGLNRLYADRANWPESVERQIRPFSNPEVWAFIKKAFAAGKPSA